MIAMTLLTQKITINAEKKNQLNFILIEYASIFNVKVLLLIRKYYVGYSLYCGMGY